MEGFCPNCGGKAERTGNAIFCEKCDTLFNVATKESKVKEIGPLEEIKSRLSRIEAMIGQPAKSNPEHGHIDINEIDTDGEENEPLDDEEDILPR